MRLHAPILVLLSSTVLAACGKPSPPDPTKPIPWIVKPKDSAGGVPGDVTAASGLAGPDVQVRVKLSKQRPDGADTCDVPRGYEEVPLADVVASPSAYGGRKIQVAGWLGVRWSFVGFPVEDVPVCQSHASYSLGEAEPEGLLTDAPDERVDLRGPEVVKVGTSCLSAEVPDADVVVAWGTVSAAGDQVQIDGSCAADEIPCDSAARCPGAMACGPVGLCELP
jgi:hypothetical protein